MKYVPPVFVGAAGIIVAITTGLVQAHNAHASLIPYLPGYCVAAVLVVLALIMAVVSSKREQLKPRIVPVRYGSLPDRRCGLIIANEGEPAYDISVAKSQVLIGAARLKFMPGIARLTKEAGEALLEAWIELSPGKVSMGSDLFDQMRNDGVPAITLNVIYKDGESRWYKSVCKIERDVLAAGGITTRFVGQRRTKLFGFLC
jgi:hypothetical protein